MYYTQQLEEATMEKKKALVAVCTLGLSQTPLCQLFKDSEDAKKQMSFANSPIGGIFKIFWFVLWTVITMTGLWIVNIFKLVYYAGRCHRLKKLITDE